MVILEQETNIRRMKHRLKNMKWIVLVALLLFISPAFALTYSGNLVNNSDFSLTRVDNSSLPDAWFYDNFNEALPSYPPMVDRGTWNLNLFYLEGGLKLRANITNEGNNEFVRSDIYNLTALAYNSNKTRTVNVTFEFISNFTADSMYFYTYHSAVGDPENEVDDAIVEFLVSYDETYSCTKSSSKGNISVLNCTFSHVGDTWSLSSLYEVNESFSGLFSIAIAAQPATCCSMVDNVTFTDINAKFSMDYIPPVAAFPEHPYYRQLNITAGSGGLSLPYSVNYTFDHAALAGAGKSSADASDVFVYYNLSGAMTSLDRINISEANTSALSLLFRLQENIAGSGYDDKYFLAYGNFSLTAPNDATLSTFPLGSGRNATGIWQLEEGTGSTSADNSSSANDLNLSGSAAWNNTDGVVANDSYIRDGYGITGHENTNDYLIVPSNETLNSYNATQAFTITAWIYLNKMPTNSAGYYVATIASNQMGTYCWNDAFSFFISSSGKITTSSMDCSGSAINTESIGIVQTNKWQLATMSWNTTGQYIWIDGKLDNNGSTTPYFYYTTADWLIGALGGCGNECTFDGTFAEVGVFNRSSTDDEQQFWYYRRGSYQPEPSIFTGFETLNVPKPTVEIQSPANGTGYGYSIISLNFTVNGNNQTIDKCWYILDANASVNLPSCANATFGAVDGTHTVAVYANNTAGANGSSEIVVFYADTAAPSITVESPLNATYNTSSVAVNYTASDAFLSSCTMELDGSNATLPGCINTTTGSLSEAQHMMKIFANDTFGNGDASALVYFTITLPVIVPPVIPPTGMTGAAGLLIDAVIMIFLLLMVIIGFLLITRAGGDINSIIYGFIIMLMGVVFAAIMFAAVHA
jgi:hypothetical protein